MVDLSPDEVHFVGKVGSEIELELLNDAVEAQWLARVSITQD